MHLRRRIAARRLERVRGRARIAAASLASPVIEVSGVSEWIVTPGASRACGTWADKPDGRRCSERVPAAGEISLRKTGSLAFEVPLGDVSTHGCKVELVEAIHLNDRVVARFPGLEPFGGRVAWVDSRCAGVHFDRSMHPAVFDLLLSRLD
jgi:hypothetical protein